MLMSLECNFFTWIFLLLIHNPENFHFYGITINILHPSLIYKDLVYNLL